MKEKDYLKKIFVFLVWLCIIAFVVDLFLLWENLAIEKDIQALKKLLEL